MSTFNCFCLVLVCIKREREHFARPDLISQLTKQGEFNKNLPCSSINILFWSVSIRSTPIKLYKNCAFYSMLYVCTYIIFNSLKFWNFRSFIWDGACLRQYYWVGLKYRGSQSVMFKWFIGEREEPERRALQLKSLMSLLALFLISHQPQNQTTYLLHRMSDLTSFRHFTWYHRLSCLPLLSSPGRHCPSYSLPPLLVPVTCQTVSSEQST